MRLMALATIWILFSLACQSECPPVQTENPCDYTYEQVVASIGAKVPTALDYNDDGEVTLSDFNEWGVECASGGEHGVPEDGSD